MRAGGQGLQRPGADPGLVLCSRPAEGRLPRRRSWALARTRAPGPPQPRATWREGRRLWAPGSTTEAATGERPAGEGGSGPRGGGCSGRSAGPGELRPSQPWGLPVGSCSPRQLCPSPGAALTGHQARPQRRTPRDNTGRPASPSVPPLAPARCGLRVSASGRWPCCACCLWVAPGPESRISTCWASVGEAGPQARSSGGRRHAGSWPGGQQPMSSVLGPSKRLSGPLAVTVVTQQPPLPRLSQGEK